MRFSSTRKLSITLERSLEKGVKGHEYSGMSMKSGKMSIESQEYTSLVELRDTARGSSPLVRGMSMSWKWTRFDLG